MGEHDDEPELVGTPGERMQKILAERHPPIQNPIPDPTTEEEWAKVHYRPCHVCGQSIRWSWGSTLQGPWLAAEAHTAPCGRGCRGAGVSPVRAEGGLSVFHGAETCGEPSCPGGMVPFSHFDLIGGSDAP